jgi:hypothetical protein
MTRVPPSPLSFIAHAQHAGKKGKAYLSLRCTHNIDS